MPDVKNDADIKMLVIELAERFKEEDFETQALDDRRLVVNEMTFYLCTDAEKVSVTETHYILPAQHDTWVLFVLIYVLVMVKKNEQITESARSFAYSLGLRDNLKGFRLIIDSVIVSVLCAAYTSQQMSQLFLIVSLLNGDTIICIERSISHSITRAWLEERKKLVKHFRKKPTVSQLLAEGASRLREELM